MIQDIKTILMIYKNRTQKECDATLATVSWKLKSQFGATRLLHNVRLLEYVLLLSLTLSNSLSKIKLSSLMLRMISVLFSLTHSHNFR